MSFLSQMIATLDCWHWQTGVVLKIFQAIVNTIKSDSFDLRVFTRLNLSAAIAAGKTNLSSYFYFLCTEH